MGLDLSAGRDALAAERQAMTLCLVFAALAGVLALTAAALAGVAAYLALLDRIAPQTALMLVAAGDFAVGLTIGAVARRFKRLCADRFHTVEQLGLVPAPESGRRASPF